MPWIFRPFRKCHGDKDCTKIATNGPGMMAKDVKYNIQKMNEAFEDGYCFLHPDRGNVPDGICLPKRYYQSSTRTYDDLACDLHPRLFT